MKHKQQLANLAGWRAASLEELDKKLAELDKDLQSFRLQKATGQLGQNHLLASTRRDIARIKTVMNEKTREAGKEESSRKKA